MRRGWGQILGVGGAGFPISNMVQALGVAGIGAEQQLGRTEARRLCPLGDPRGSKVLSVRSDPRPHVQVQRTHDSLYWARNSTSVSLERFLLGRLRSTEVRGAGRGSIIGSRGHLGFGPELGNASCGEIGLQPLSHERQGTPPFTSHGWLFLCSHFPGPRLGKRSLNLYAPDSPKPTPGSCQGAGPFSLPHFPPRSYSILPPTPTVCSFSIRCLHPGFETPNAGGSVFSIQKFFPKTQCRKA